MGEELKESKTYFKTSEDDEYKEIKTVKGIAVYPDPIVEQINAINDDMCCMCTGFENAASVLYPTLEFCVDKEFFKKLKKDTGIAHLSKKRTRKLLMAHGFDRDSAQMYADIMKPRNMWEINELIKIKEESLNG